MVSHMRERSRGMRRASAAAALTLLVAAGVELGARGLHLQAAAPSAFLPPSCLRRSASLGAELAPSCKGWLRAGSPVRTNSLGLRDREIEADGAARILAVGDSCTYGWNVPPEAAFPQRVERLLAERGGTRRYRVINAGVPGYTSTQGLIFLREKNLLALRPSVLILSFGFNDGARLGDVEELLRWQRRMMPVFRADDFLLRSSELWRWLRVHTTAPPPQIDTRLAPRVAPERFKRNLTEMVRLGREHGARPMLIRFFRCAAKQVDPTLGQDCRAFARAFEEAARESNAPAIVYEGPIFDIVHPTAEGYEQLAREIVARLDAGGYLAPEDRVEGWN